MNTKQENIDTSQLSSQSEKNAIKLFDLILSSKVNHVKNEGFVGFNEMVTNELQKLYNMWAKENEYYKDDQHNKDKVREDFEAFIKQVYNIKYKKENEDGESENVLKIQAMFDVAGVRGVLNKGETITLANDIIVNGYVANLKNSSIDFSLPERPAEESSAADKMEQGSQTFQSAETQPKGQSLLSRLLEQARNLMTKVFAFINGGNSRVEIKKVDTSYDRILEENGEATQKDNLAVDKDSPFSTVSDVDDSPFSDDPTSPDAHKKTNYRN